MAASRPESFSQAASAILSKGDPRSCKALRYRASSYGVRVFQHRYKMRIHFTTSTRSKTAIAGPNQSVYALNVKPHSGSTEPSWPTAIARPSRHENSYSWPKTSHQKGNDSQIRLASPHTISQSLFLIGQRVLQFAIASSVRSERLSDEIILPCAPPMSVRNIA